MKKFNSLLFFGIALLLHFGCANKVTPTGGIKDITPPDLLLSVPENNSVNFSSKVIILTFNEYIQLKDISKQLVISPPILPAPVIEIRKKSVVIELGDSIAPNTTYTINFGNAIVDNNENNPFAGFRYVFSTGSYIDSLKVKGTITAALTGKPEQGAVALLYNASTHDTLILKKLPDYFSRADSNGVFEILNVRPGNYRLFALTEKSNNYIFDASEELVGFAEKPFELKDSAEFKIAVNTQYVSKQNVKSTALIQPGKLITVFDKPVTELSWNFPEFNFDKVFPEINLMGDTVTLYCVPAPVDSVKVIWYEQGSIVDTALYTFKKISAKADTSKLSTGYVFYPSNGADLIPETVPSIKWWAPVTLIDSTKVIFKRDSIEIPVKVSFTDSLHTSLSFEGEWKEGEYLIKILPGMVVDIYGNSNDSITTSFTIPLEKTKGSISFKVMTLEPGKHILQLINDKDEMVRQRLFDELTTGIFELLDPGTYRMRIITDSNENQRWDGGNYLLNVLPEEVRYYGESIVVRANWEVEMEWMR